MRLQFVCGFAFLTLTLTLALSPMARAAPASDPAYTQVAYDLGPPGSTDAGADFSRYLTARPLGSERSLAHTGYRIAHGDRIVIPIELNGTGTFEFVVDTASSRTVLFDHVRARLGLSVDPKATMTIYGMVGEQSAIALKLDSLRIGDELLRGIEVADLPDPRHDDDEADGILGLDILERYDLLFDRGSETFHLYSRRTGLPHQVADWNQVRLQHQKLPTTPCAFWFFGTLLNHSASATLLDLGAGITVINWQMAEKMGFHKADFPITQASEELRDVVGKSEPVILITELHIKIGQAYWANKSVLVANTKVFGLLGLDEIPATILGAGLLKDSSFAIDFKNEVLYIL